MCLDDKYSRPLEELRKHTIQPLPISALEALPTKALLGRLNRLRSCADCPEAKLWTIQEFLRTQNKIVFKETNIWRKALADLKSVLSKREHVERGSKEKRQRNAQQQRHR